MLNPFKKKNQLVKYDPRTFNADPPPEEPSGFLTAFKYSFSISFGWFLGQIAAGAAKIGIFLLALLGMSVFFYLLLLINAFIK